MLYKVLESVNRDIYVYPPRAIAIDAHPFAVCTICAKSTTIHPVFVLRCLLHKTNRGPQTVCQVKLDPQGDQAGAQKLFIEEQIYVCSSKKHFERLLSPCRPVALSPIFIVTLWVIWTEPVLWTHLQSLFPPASEGIERSQNLPIQACWLLSHFHPFIKNLWVSWEVWDSATWTIRSSIWFYMSDPACDNVQPRPLVSQGHSRLVLACRPTEASPRLGKDDYPFRLVIRGLVTTFNTLARLEIWPWTGKFQMCLLHVCLPELRSGWDLMGPINTSHQKCKLARSYSFL